MKRIYWVLLTLFVTVPLAMAGASFQGIDKNASGQMIFHFSGGDIIAPFTVPTGGYAHFVNGYNGNQPAISHCSISPLVTNQSASCSAKTDDSTPSWSTQTISGGGTNSATGTITFTITRTGYYLLIASTQFAGGSYTGASLMRHIFGGTAGNVFGSNNTETFDTPASPTNDNTVTSYHLYNITSSGQTITLNVFFQVGIASGTVTGYEDVTVIPL